MLQPEADGYESAGGHRDGAGTDARRLSGRQCTGLHYRRDAYSGLDADQQWDVPAQVANAVHTDRRQYPSNLGHGDYSQSYIIDYMFNYTVFQKISDNTGEGMRNLHVWK